MSYRVIVNGYQLFGNNETYPRWGAFLEKQGIQIDEEGCYDGEITDFMGAIEVLEDIVMDIERERETIRNHLLNDKTKNNEALRQTIGAKFPSLFDMSGIKNELLKGYKTPRLKNYLLDELTEFVHYGYVFLPYLFYRTCEKDLEAYADPNSGRLCLYRLKKGRTIKIHTG